MSDEALHLGLCEVKIRNARVENEGRSPSFQYFSARQKRFLEKISTKKRHEAYVKITNNEKLNPITR